MPLAREIEAIVREGAKMPKFNTMRVTEARALIAQMSVGEAADPLPELGEIRDFDIKGRDGAITVRLYRPRTQGPHPLLMYFHGGGFVLGDLDTDDAMCRRYCALADCVVVSVDYRLAPEYKFPVAPNDCLDATLWAIGEGADILGIDKARYALGGMSAGGNLAAVVALMLRDGGHPAPKGQLLLVPVTDCAGDPETASYAEFADGYMVPAVEMYWFWDLYTDLAGRTHPYAAPLRAKDLTNLPPALVLTGECDVLRDEGEAYAKRLEAAGVEVEAHRYAGMNHFLCAFTAISETSRRAVSDQIAWLKRIF